MFCFLLDMNQFTADLPHQTPVITWSKKKERKKVITGQKRKREKMAKKMGQKKVITGQDIDFLFCVLFLLLVS